MAEINKRNLVDETAKVYAANTLASNPTPLFSTGMPAKIIRASIANTNLLSKDGDLFVGTGGTYTETIDGTEYTYAKIAKKNQSELFVDGLNSTATNVGLAASVGKFIDNRLHISTAVAGDNSITLGTNAATSTSCVGIGSGAKALGTFTVAIGTSAGTNSTSSIALGSGARATAEAAIQLGSGTNETASSFRVGLYQMLDLKTGKMPIERINATGTPTSLVLGGSSSGADCVAYGFNSDAGGMGSVAIGYGASVLFNGGIAIGKNAKLNSQGIPKNCIAIGNEANVTYKSTEESGTVIQLGAGTNSAGGFQVGDYQLMNSDGIIPSERRPVYKCTVQYPNPISNPTSSSQSVDIYYFDWYSNTNELTSGKYFTVTGYQETRSLAAGGYTSVYKPCCGRIGKVGDSMSLRIFNYYGNKVSGIEKEKIGLSSQLL